MLTSQMIVQLDVEKAKFDQALIKAEQKARQFSERTTQYLNNIEKAAISINKYSGFTFFSGVIGQMQNTLGFLPKYADGYTEIQNKLKLVESASINSVQGLQSVFDISLKTNQNIEATSSIYQRFAQNADRLQLSQAKVASLTETVSKAVAISGASAASSQAALMQFGQALASGVLRGQEFNSVMEQTPGLSHAIARGLNVSIGELRQMANEGMLTMDIVIQALTKAKDSVDKQYESRVLTISAAFENLRTATLKWVGGLDQTIGISNQAAQVINSLSSHLNTAAVGFAALGIAIGIKKVRNYTAETNLQAASILSAAKAEKLRTATIRQQAAAEMSLLQYKLANIKTDTEAITIKKLLEAQEIKLTSAIHAEAAARQKLAIAEKQSTLAGRLFGGALGFVGGPMGALSILAITGASAIYDWYQSTQQAKEEALRYADTIDQLSQNLDNMTAAQINAESVKAKNAIKEQKAELDDLIQKHKLLEIQAKETDQVIYSSFGGPATYIKKSAEEIEQAQDNLAISAEKVENAQNKLNKSYEWLKTLQAHLPVQDIKDRIQELYPQLDMTKIKFDDFNSILTNFGSIAPGVVDGSNNIAVSMSNMAVAIGIAATSMSQLKLAMKGGIDAPKIGEKAQAEIDRINKRQEIDKLRKEKKYKEASQKQALMEGENLKFTGNDLKAYADARANELLTQWTPTSSGVRSGSKGGRSKGIDYQRQLTDQLTGFQTELSTIRANRKSIDEHKQISQYQEVNKLTQDIAANAEKYKNFGVEGTQKLLDMASAIDSENQKLAISQLKIENKEKLDAMEFELTLLGKTKKEQELLQYNNRLDLEAQKLKIGMTKENAILLDQEIAKLKERYAQIQAEEEKHRSSATLGVKQGFIEIQDDVTNVASNMKNITVAAFGSMSDALTDFVMTGKADFADMATSIMKDISNMIIKMMLFNAIKSAGSAMGFDMSFIGGASGGGYAYGNGRFGFAEGGFTGLGGKYQPAGIVHRGEYVLTKEATSRIGLDYLNYLNYGNGRGFANGGGVGVPKVPNLNIKSALPTPNVKVNVINNGEPAEASVSTKQNNGQLEITVELIRRLAKAEATNAIQTNFRPGGVFA